MRRHAVFLRYSVYSMSHMKLGQAQSLFPQKRKMRRSLILFFLESLRLARPENAVFLLLRKNIIHTYIRVYVKLIYKRGNKNFILFIYL